MTKQIATANANASRAFFVEMLTRDIALDDCVLDLLDNSVDGAWRSLGRVAPGLNDGVDLSAFRIEIVATPGRFAMTDNCGGMTQTRAEKYAFTFGRQAAFAQEAESSDAPNNAGADDAGVAGDGAAEGGHAEGDEEGDYSIGVYGIGMKRALFKLGRNISIHSTYRSGDGDLRAFKVPINVPTWMAGRETDWSFEILEAEPAAEAGMAIEVLDLTKGTHNAFSNPATLQNLQRVIERDYALHLHRGLRVSLNGAELVPMSMTLLQSADFAPVNRSWDIAIDGGTVHVELLAGANAPPPEEDSPDEEDRGEARFGWYVACNGRIVLAADKTATSIWGLEGFPMWHRQYRGFFGLVMFTSEDTELLPLTTTKRSVDQSSEVYRQTRPAMREATRAWIDYTTARKGDREAAKEKEAAAKAVTIFELPARQVIATPAVPARPRIKTTSIQYSEPVARVRALGEALGNVNMPATQVGARSFAYAFDELVGED